MAWSDRARFLNATVAVVTVFAWVAGTNHCVLGLMKQPENMAVSMSHCPDHAKKPGDSDHGSSGMLACCQGLQSPIFELAKSKIDFSPFLVARRSLAISHLIPPEAPKDILLSPANDTGPPSAGFFVGTVLRRSLRENGPPPRS
jgi:hypothetical protein